MNKKKTILSFVVLGATVSTLILTGCGSKEGVNEINYESPKYDAVENNNENRELSGSDGATNDKKMMQGREQNRMSEEPIEACMDKSEGDACSFALMSPDGEESDVEGECSASPRDESVLMCASDDMPQNGRGGRPGAINESE